jgi:uncharacterized beta-barrel protein YwiB (DUF1934 family)
LTPKRTTRPANLQPVPSPGYNTKTLAAIDEHDTINIRKSTIKIKYAFLKQTATIGDYQTGPIMHRKLYQTDKNGGENFPGGKAA